jgi:serine/threonine-protein kinase RsbW
MNTLEPARFFGISVPGDAQSLALIRLLMTHLAEVAGFQEEDIGKIEIAVDEACTNVIEHAYASMTPKPSIRLEVESKPDRLTIDIVDQGKSFDYNSYIPPRFPDHWNEGNNRGVGLYLIRKCMDDSSYTRLPDKSNRLRLIKNILKTAPSK